MIQRGSMRSLRRSLYIRSVPMLPGPTIAAVCLVISLLWGSGEAQVDRAEVGEVGDELVPGSYVDRGVARARQDHVPGLEGDSKRGPLVREPGDRRDGVA